MECGTKVDSGADEGRLREEWENIPEDAIVKLTRLMTNRMEAIIQDQLVRAAPVAGGLGMTLLQKMGWQPGRGLGKEGTGALQPLLLEIKMDTRGLVAKEELRPFRNQKRGGVIPPFGTHKQGTSLIPMTHVGKHPVSLLGEFCSKRKLGAPSYTLCYECGPDHKKNFLFKVRIDGTEYQPAVASINKKQAKADAALLALQKLGIVP